MGQGVPEVDDRSCGDFEGVSIDTGENREDFFALSGLCQIALLNFEVRVKSSARGFRNQKTWRIAILFHLGK